MTCAASAPKLTVVVPTCGRTTLLRTLTSLERQTLRPAIEVIVVGQVDDARVATALGELCRRAPFIRPISVSYPSGDSSRKKNDGLRASRAQIVAFLDDDAYAPPEWAERILEPFEHTEVVLVSGPSLVPTAARGFARLAGLALASRAAGYVAARYRAAGARPYPAVWSRVIGCDMAWRKAALEAIGGFDARFWPGEEMWAAWLAVGRDARRMRLHPGAGVEHEPRSTLGAFWRQIVGYGATRIRLLRAGTPLEWPTLLPAAMYLAIALWLLALPWVGQWGWRAAACAGLAYVLFVAWAAAEIVWRTRRRRDAAVVWLIPVMHLAYGWGCWRELFAPNQDLGAPLAPEPAGRARQ